MSTENGTNTLIQPPAGLLTQVTNPQTNQPDYAFPLQTNAWLKMQGVVTQALAFQLNSAGFEDLYGTFNDEGSVETALSILGQINTTAAKYGDPQTLISSLRAFQKSDTPPSTIYAHAVWLAAQTQLAAQQIESLLNVGLTDIGKDETDPTQRLQDLTALLIGVGGVNSYAAMLQGYISGLGATITFTAAGSNGDTVTINGVVITLVTSGPTGNEILIGDSAVATAINLYTFLTAQNAPPALEVANYSVSASAPADGPTVGVVTIFNSSSIAGNSFTLATSSTAITLSGATLGEDTGFLGAVSDFYDELNPQLTGQSNSLQWYLNQSSNIYTDAQNAVSSDEQQIDQLNDQIKQLNEEYIGFTVAASVSPVLLLFPFFGIFLAIADATTFAVLASKVKDQLNDLSTSLNSATGDEQKKSALVAQLGGFNKVAGNVETDGQDFLNAISKLLSGWAEFSNQITTRLSALTPEDLEDWSKFMDEIHFQTALDGWKLIEAKAEAFFQTGFVQFSTDTSSWLSV
jgi:hypothetical protein